MKVAVCVKWVPVVARMKFDLETRRIVRDGVPSELNSYDQLAVQWAVDHKDRYGLDVDVYTMGPPGALQGLQQCLAMGADRVFHIMDQALAGSDTLATARALSLALRRERYDLMLFGYHSVDAETGQVGPEVAEFLGLPQITSVSSLDIVHGDTARAERETEDGVQIVECALPAVLSVVEGIAAETFPTREAMQAAREREAEHITAADLSSDSTIFGNAGSPTWVAEIQFVESERGQRILDEETPTEDAAREVAAYLQGKGLLDPAARTARDSEAPAASPAVRPASGPAVWVVAEPGESALRSATSELLGAASSVADAIGGHVVGVLFGEPGVAGQADAFIAAGADAVALAVDDGLAAYATDAYTATIADAMERHQPYAVLLPSTVNGRDLAARVAGRLGLGLTGDCVGLSVDDEGRLVQLKPAFGGNIVAPILSRTQPYMATIRPGLLERLRPNPARQGASFELAVSLPHPPAVRVVDTRRIEEEGVAIENAWCVVAVGMGVGDKERIADLKPLADHLGAELVCTRDVVEAGWMPHQRQVGLTGRSVAPALYIGVGVRGDFNHTVGIQRAGTVVAINNNKRAQFFRACDIGVIAEWSEFLPALLRALQEAG